MTPRKTHLDALSISLLIGCCLFWGFQQVLVKITLAEVPPVFQASLRFAGATLLLWLWCQWRGIRLFEADGSGRAGLLVGLLFAGEFACLYAGLQLTSASRLTLFLYTAPFVVAWMLPYFVKSEKLHAQQWLGLLCAFVAVVWVLRESFHAPQHTHLTRLGDGLALAAGLLWGLTTVTIRATRLSMLSPEKTLFYQIAISSVCLPWVSYALGETWHFHFSSLAIGSLFVQTVLGAFVSYLLWMWMLRHYPATKISAFVFLTPLFALMFSALWLDEVVTPSLLIAMILVALGIMLVNFKRA